MKNVLAYLSLFILFILFSACNENEPLQRNQGKVEIYTLEHYKTIDKTFRIDKNSVVLDNSPCIEYEDLVSYNAKEYVFSFSENARSIIKNIQHSVHGIAFAVVANDDLIYTGYFWPGYSSMSCDWITIDPIGIEFHGKGYVNMGYPGPPPNFTIPVERNDARIIEIFRRDNKLIE